MKHYVLRLKRIMYSRLLTSQKDRSVDISQFITTAYLPDDMSLQFITTADLDKMIEGKNRTDTLKYDHNSEVGVIR